MQHKAIVSGERIPGDRVRILVESERLGTDAPDRVGNYGVDVIICSGPQTVLDACPLVVDGICRHGRADVVVSDLDGEWVESIRRAWSEQAVPSTRVARRDDVDADTHLRSCVGAALTELFAATFGASTS